MNKLFKLESCYLDLDMLYQEYSNLLISSFSKAPWESGMYIQHRINWKNTKLVKQQLDEFKVSGVYIWGVKKQPLYIGKAEKQVFAKRFSSRYVNINKGKAQCNLAALYSNYLSQGGVEKTEEAIKSEYKISRVRAVGVKYFGEADAKEIWFILLPISENLISKLETSLITVGNKWNVANNYQPLINILK